MRAVFIHGRSLPTIAHPDLQKVTSFPKNFVVCVCVRCGCSPCSRFLSACSGTPHAGLIPSGMRGVRAWNVCVQCSTQSFILSPRSVEASRAASMAWVIHCACVYGKYACNTQSSYSLSTAAACPASTPGSSRRSYSFVAASRAASMT